MRAAIAVATALLLAPGASAAPNNVGAKLLEGLDADAGVRKDASGLYIRVIKSGDPAGLTPEPHTSVNLSYIGKLPDGSDFDGTPLPKIVTPAWLFEGFRTAVMMMRPGDKWQVYIPPELGFGESARGQVPANSVLIFDIEVHDFPPPPEGFWKVLHWCVTNPVKIIGTFFLLKTFLDWYFGVVVPAGPLVALELVRNKNTNPRVSLDVSIDGKRAGVVVCELYDKALPRTTELFRTVCVTDAVSYKKGRPNHRFEAVDPDEVSRGRVCFRAAHPMSGIVPDYDLLTCAEHDKGYFTHGVRYLLSLANAGKLQDDTPIEVFLTLGKAEHFDGRHVVFGAVVEGQAVVDEVEKARAAGTKVMVTKCQDLGGWNAKDAKKEK